MIRCMILGGAVCWDADVRVLEEMVGPWDGLVVAVNDVGTVWPRKLDAWASVHGGQFHAEVSGKGDWVRKRRKNGYPPAEVLVGHSDQWAGVQVLKPRWPGGSSGLFAVEVALRLFSADRVVLCGVPMDGMLNPFHGREWRAHQRHRQVWVQSLKYLDRVRSMSGWTADALGLPDPDWLRHT